MRLRAWTWRCPRSRRRDADRLLLLKDGHENDEIIRVRTALNNSRLLRTFKDIQMKTNTLLLSAIVALAAPAHAQTVVNIPPATVANSTVLPSGATVNVLDGGSIGLGVDLSNGTLNIRGGRVAIGATGIPSGFTNSNNTVNVSGGTVGPFFQFFNSDGFITGGTLDTFGVFSGSTVTIEGGNVTGFPDVFSNGTVNIRGGNVASVRALTGSTINIFGSDFAFNGVPVSGMTENAARLVSERNVTLTATLEDGSPFEIFLRSFDPGFPTPDVAVTNSTITLTLTARPCPGDCDGSGEVAFADLVSQLFAFGPVDDGSECDTDGSGNVDFSDLIATLFAFGPCP